MNITTPTIVLSVVFVVACYGFAHVIFDVVTDFILLAHVIFDVVTDFILLAHGN